MNDLQVFRSSTTAEQEIVFEFPDNGIEFLIKNFTNSDIFVAGRQGTQKSDRILIPANSWQMITPFPYSLHKHNICHCNGNQRKGG